MLHDRLRGQGSMTNVERILTLDYYTYYDPFYFAKDGMMYYWRAIIERVFVDNNTPPRSRSSCHDGWMDAYPSVSVQTAVLNASLHTVYFRVESKKNQSY